MGGLHNVQMPAGPQSAALFDLWMWMLVACAIVFVAVMAALIVALCRTPRATHATPPDIEPDPQRDSRLRRGVALAVAICSLMLAALLAGSFLTDRAIANLPLDDPLRIDLVAHQFWWEARYDPTDPLTTFATANEIHVPVGRPVLLTLRADDVIHSFWVPSLHGKKDLIPGRESTFAFRADHVGIYRGQCAEFCGFQHAHMTLFVIADEPADYEAWAVNQRHPAPPPANDEERRGRDLVEHSTCAMCHRVAGTLAQARRAPDLTHIASRQTLGAGAIANNETTLAQWIVDAQKIKPGINMPPLALPPADTASVVAYLRSLQ